MYKTLFLDFFKIDPSDVIGLDNMSTKNVCIFPSPISSLNDVNYQKIIQNFIQIFHDA